MQHQIHGSYAQHGGIGIEAMEHGILVMVGILTFQQFFLIVLLHILCTLHDEASTSHCGVTNRVFQGRLHQFDHHTDDVSWRSELSVVTTRRHLAKDVFVSVAHGVAVVHV